LGETYGNTLFLAGALVPSKVLAGEWWRIGSAMFLHANWIHIGSNMLALFYYGSYVEARLDWLRFGLIYTISGLGSMLAMMGVALLQGEPDLHGVGASGAVMGLLGTMIALVWRRSQSSQKSSEEGRFTGARFTGARLTGARFTGAQLPDGQTLRLLLMLVVLQTFTDFLIPQVSASAHLSGLAIGMALGSLVGGRHH
jgi:rhomboid protease GluP